MATTSEIAQAAQPTEFFIGTCTPCKTPVRASQPGVTGRYVLLTCPDCGDTTIRAERLWGARTPDICDGSCMSAIGPRCQCSCGGANHGLTWGLRYTTHELTETQLATYQAALTKQRSRLEGVEKRRVQRAQTQAQAAADRFQQWLDDLNPEVRGIIDHVRASFENVQDSGLLIDMRLQMLDTRKGGPQPLTPHQLRATVNWVRREREMEARRARWKAEEKPVPTGKVAVQGVIVKTALKDSYGGRGKEEVMRVKGDGWMVEARIPARYRPATLTAADYRDEDNLFGLQGKQISFDATVKAARFSESFGYAAYLKNIQMGD